MNVLNTSMSLDEIEKELAKQLRDPENNIRILGDLNLSYEDYNYIVLKIRGLDQHNAAMKALEQYQLCVLVSWIFSLRMEKNDYSVCKRIQNYLFDNNQQLVRKYVVMLLDTFHEYGLNTYQYTEDGSVEVLLELLVVHTGIPTELHDDFYHLLDDSMGYGEFSPIANRFLMRLPQHMKNLYEFVSREVVIAMIEDCRKMFTDYRVHGITQKEAYRKYPIMSSDIMQGCFRWCEAQETYSKCFV